MRFRKAVWMPGIFVVFVLALAACGGSDAAATPVPTASVSSTANATSQDSASTADSDYLREVLRAERSSLPIFQNFRTIFGQTYPLREALIDALLTAGVGTPFIEKTAIRSEEHTSELQSRRNLVCRLLLEKKKKTSHT